MMRRFIRYTMLAVLLLALAVSITSCNKPRTPRPKFQVVSLDKVSGTLQDGWTISLTVANNTGANVHITDATATLLYKGRKVALLTLDGDVLLPRRQCSKVDVPLRAKLSFSALPLLGKVRKGELSDITVDYSLSINALTRHRIFEQQNIPLEALVKKFNLGFKK